MQTASTPTTVCGNAT